MNANTIIAALELLAQAEPGIEAAVKQVIAAFQTTDPDTLNTLLAQANAAADAQHAAAQG